MFDVPKVCLFVSPHNIISLGSLKCLVYCYTYVHVIRRASGQGENKTDRKMERTA